MNMHTKLASHYGDVRSRLLGTPSKPIKTLPIVKLEDESAVIAELKRDKRCLEIELKEARLSLRYVAEREQHHRETERKMEKLELDLADARARILSQAELMKVLDDSESGEPMDKRRPVHEIVAEVLQHYPGITWDDVKGIRRTRDLIAPRHACMRAVYNERKDLSLPRLGRIFQRDHTTLIHAIKKDFPLLGPQE